MPSRRDAPNQAYPNKQTLYLSDEGSDALTDLIAHFKKRRTRKSSAGAIVDALLRVAKRDAAVMNERIEMLLPLRARSAALGEPSKSRSRSTR